MPRVRIPVVGPSYPARERALSAQVTKNLYPTVDSEAKATVSLHAFPGLKEFTGSGIDLGVDRGLFVTNGKLFQAKGSGVYRINEDGTDTALNTIAGTGRCDFASDGVYLVVTGGGDPAINDGYVNSVSTAAVDADLTDPTTVGMLNGFFVFDNNIGNVAEWVSSAVNDPTDINALDYAEASSLGGDILRIIVHNNLVYFFGNRRLEPWWNSGTGNPPFDRVQSGMRPFGVAGPWAVTTDGGRIFFLDDSMMPNVMTGFDPQPIGNPALGQEWASYGNPESTVALAYRLHQQQFFQLNFPGANRSWCWHEPSNTWFQLADGVGNDMFRCSSYAFCYGKHLMADSRNGKIYELDFATYDNDGDPIQRKRVTASIHGGLYDAPGAILTFNRVEFDMQVGYGLTTGQGSDPQLMVRYSDDGGHTWSAEQWVTLGVGGDYLRKVVLHQQGRAMERIYELTYSDPTPMAVLSGWADIEFSDGPL